MGPSLLEPLTSSELCKLIDGLPRRSAAVAPVLLPARPKPLQLVAAAPFRRPIAPVRASATAHAVPCAYEPLDTPAPIAEQVGNYLPYRPSRIRIPGAC